MRKIFLFLLLLSLLFSCKITKRRIVDRVESIEQINFVFDYSDDIIINGKSLMEIMDDKESETDIELGDAVVSSEVVDEEGESEVTEENKQETGEDEYIVDDFLTDEYESDKDKDKKVEKNVFSTRDREYFLNYKDVISDIFYQKTKDAFSIFEIDVFSKETYYQDDVETNESASFDDFNGFKLEVYIKEYNVGEFNMIRNLNTSIYLHVLLVNEQGEVISEFLKQYVEKPSIVTPLESHRISKIADDCTKDIINLVNSSTKINLNKLKISNDEDKSGDESVIDTDQEETESNEDNK